MAVRLDTITKLENGARFYTGDLHVHSYGGSADVADAQMTAEAIVQAAIKQRISLLAITDHNNDINVSRAMDAAGKYADRLLVIPGAEISTANGHVLAYFAPESASRLRDLLAFIRIVGDPGARDSHTTMSMADVIAQTERLGGLAIAAHIDREKYGFERLADGYPNWKKDIITSSGLYGLEFDEPKNLAWYSHDDDKSPAGSERRKLLKAREGSSATVARVALAAIQGSDAHSLKDFEAQHANRIITRFKMHTLSFDGLRTALVDSEARVRAVSTIPRSFPRVIGMHVEGGFLDGTTIHLSPNLNCFIGGRGTGKSTTIQSLTYGLGFSDDFADRDNCPDAIVVYAEDADGVVYRYERHRGNEPTVQAKEDGSITDVPTDSFTLEFYGQGLLGEVAKDPLGRADLLQAFLDRHIALDDLRAAEREILDELQQNSAQLLPLEASASQLPPKNRELNDINKKLQIAEAGRLREVAALQSAVAAEKTLARSLREIQKVYSAGVSLSKFIRSYANTEATAGVLTSDQPLLTVRAEGRAVIEQANKFIGDQEKSLNVGLADYGKRLDDVISRLSKRHVELDQTVADKIETFRKQGLSGDLTGLNTLLNRRSALSAEISRIDAQSTELNEARTRRGELLKQLAATRAEIIRRRKDQLAAINQHLRETIDDYHINFYYDSSGLVEPFRDVLLRTMQGTYFQEEAARSVSEKTTPAQLATAVRAGDLKVLSSIVGPNWATEVLRRFSIWKNLHELEVTPKFDKPVIKVTTKSAKPKTIPANQLSDGQKHTILLTIAMMAESEAPLVIDQPEDDLDNAFISSSVVRTLRSIKERRQVILVTHNANIAVLGDSELICPMKRQENIGVVFDRGSIDRDVTSVAVQNILEGGELAFRRRKEIYGH
jgi:hypothetical protein